MDNTSYSNTLTMLHSLNPTTILLPDTADGSVLFRLISIEYQLSQIRQIKRKFFNEETGIQLIERLGQKKCVASISFDSTKYLVCIYLLYVYVFITLNVLGWLKYLITIYHILSIFSYSACQHVVVFWNILKQWKNLFGHRNPFVSLFDGLMDRCSLIWQPSHH